MKSPNYKWIYTYDYAPDSVWEVWRTSDEVPEWIEAEADEVAHRAFKNVSDIKNSGSGVWGDSPATFILLSDSHFTYNGTWDDTVASMRALAKRLSLSGIIHLGDLTDGLLPLSKTRKIEARCLRDMESVLSDTGRSRVYLTPGNHDYNYFKGNPEISYPTRPQYYVDMPKRKLRLFFIDSFDPKEKVRYGFTDYCLHWLDATFHSMPDDYTAVIFSHLTPLVRLQAWTDEIRNRTGLMEVLNRYADKILAYINGHNHCDLLFNDLYNGKFPIISINCAKCECFPEHKPEGAIVPYRALGERIQESFDIMQIDAQKKKIFFTRFGAGDDRIVREGKAEFVSYDVEA